MDAIKRSFHIGIALYILGAVAIAVFMSISAALWFLVGGGFAILNLMAASYVVIKGLPRFKNKVVFLGLIFLKSLSFVAMVAAVLMFAKPRLLPFTMGVGIVIFSLVVWAVWESLISRRRGPKQNENINDEKMSLETQNS